MTRIRAACHVHSDWSYDGRWSLARIARELGGRGYDAVLMSEHDRGFDERRWREYREACARESSGSVLLVPGIEYSDPENVVHVTVWGDLPFLGEGVAIGPLLGKVTTLGGVAVLAHPARRNASERVEAAWLGRLAGIEIWNRKTDGWAPAAEAQALLRKAAAAAPFAVLDFHTDRQLSPLAMLLDLEATLAEASVVEAIGSGRCAPRFAGLPATSFTRTPGLQLARGAELARRRLARARRRPLLRRLEARARRRSAD